jgi:hypothetical protein
MSPKKRTRVAIYSRVSTDKQTTANQERELREIADREGWEIVETYRDSGISGAKGATLDPLSTRYARTRPDGAST